jgi:hypothetical protein
VPTSFASPSRRSCPISGAPPARPWWRALLPCVLPCNLQPFRARPPAPWPSRHAGRSSLGCSLASPSRSLAPAVLRSEGDLLCAHLILLGSHPAEPLHGWRPCARAQILSLPARIPPDPRSSPGAWLAGVWTAASSSNSGQPRAQLLLASLHPSPSSALSKSSLRTSSSPSCPLLHLHQPRAVKPLACPLFSQPRLLPVPRSSGGLGAFVRSASVRYAARR